MMKIINKWIKDFVDYQAHDFSGVKPEHRLSKRDNCFYFNSCAGVLKFKPKDDKDVARFRSKWVNRFEYIKTLEDKEQRKQYFRFYADIREQEKIKYRANLKTRLKVRVCNLIASN